MAENSAPGTTVVKIEAYDLDQNPQRLQYRISGGNPQGFFVIDSDTGKKRIKPLFRLTFITFVYLQYIAFIVEAGSETVTIRKRAF